MAVYYMPTKIVSGRNCVLENPGLFATLGSHALIVTGKSSAKNGALSDVAEVLEQNGQGFTVFDRVSPNPTVACVREGVELFRASGADFVVAIGGGSPMDAAKAIATLAKQDRKDEEIFSGGYAPVAYPMAHVPTTAGTGSEVTPYAILTNEEKETKTSISSPAMFPVYAFLDGKYLENLPHNSTVNTALDALSHAVEGMLSKNAVPLSDSLAEEAMRLLVPLLGKANEDSLTVEDRDVMLYASALAGMTIAQSGTTIVHGMGYSLTYHYGTDHGRANGLLLGETIKLCEEKGTPKLDRILRACGCENAQAFADTISPLLGEKEDIPKEVLLVFAKKAMENKNVKKSAYEPSEEDLERIFLKSFDKA